MMTAFAEGKQRQFEESKPEAAIALRVEQSTTELVQVMHPLKITNRSIPTHMIEITLIASLAIQ